MRKTNNARKTVTQERPAHIDNGDTARGAVSARTNQTATQPEDTAMSAMASSGNVAENVVTADFKAKRTGIAILDDAISAETTGITWKVETSQLIRQRLAEAQDLLAQGKDKGDQAQEIMASAETLLYMGRVNGRYSNDEVSGMLIDIFGAVPKADGTPGKTPDGKGAEIRKHIVRAVQAHEFVANPSEGSRYFDGCDPADIELVLKRVGSEENGLTPWSAYDKLGAIVKKAKEGQGGKVAAIDPRAIAKIVEFIDSEPLKMAEAFESNPALVKAYGALWLGLQSLPDMTAKAA